MPTVGSISIGVSARIEDLEKNLGKAQQRIKELEGTATKSGTKIRDSLNSASGGFDGFGKGQIAAGKLAAGLHLLSTTFRRFGGDADSVSAKVVDGATKMAMGFAFGGPIAAGIIGIVEMLGMLADSQQKAAEMTAKWAAEAAKVHDKFMQWVEEDTRAIRKRTEAILGSGKSPLTKAMEDVAKAREELARLSAMTDNEGNTLGSLGSRGDVYGKTKREEELLRQMHDQMVELRKLMPLLERVQVHEAVGAALSDYKSKAGVMAKIVAMEGELAGQRSNVATITQELLDLENERAILMRDTSGMSRKELDDIETKIEMQRQLLDATKAYNAEKANRDVASETAALNPFADRSAAEYARKIQEWTKDGASAGLIQAFEKAAEMRPMLELARGLADDLRNSLTDAVVDGLTNGFRNGAEIGRALITSMLRQTIDSLMGSLMSGVSGALAGGGGGGIGSIFQTIIGGIGSIFGGGPGGGGGSVSGSAAGLAGAISAGVGCAGGT